MTPSLLVRRLRADDWAAYRNLRLRALRTDPIAFGSSYAQEAAFPEQVWKERATAGANSSSQSTWVGEAPEGNLVGSITVVRTEASFGVFGMWVEPGHRAQGLGRVLLRTALRWAHDSDPALPAWLDVNPKQGAALHLYEELGFRRTGESKTLDHTEGEVAVRMVRPPAG